MKKLISYGILFALTAGLFGCNQAATASPSAASAETEEYNLVAEQWESDYTAGEAGSVITQTGNSYTARYFTLPESEHWIEDSMGTYPVLRSVHENGTELCYAVDETELTRPEEQAFSGVCTARGQSVPVEFTYVLSGKSMAVTEVLTDCVILDKRSTEQLLLELHLTEDGSRLNYPIFLNLVTGEFTDAFRTYISLAPFAATPCTIVFGQGQVVVKTREDVPSYYLYDTTCGEVIALNDLTDSAITGCSVLTDTEELLCWDSSGNFFRVSQAGTVCTQVLSDAEIVYADAFFDQSVGCSFFILIENEEQVCYDAVTGERFLLDLEDLSLTEAHISADGRELYWLAEEAGQYVLSGFDCDNRTLTIFHMADAPSGASASVALSVGDALLVTFSDGRSCAVYDFD